MHSSFQVAQYLLCTQCETRFQQRGEDWMMRNCYRGKGVFRLKDELTSVSPVVSLGPDRIYHAARTPKLEITKLAYFASSVFWRASVPWNFDGKEPVVPVSLGEKYGDEFRSYLLGLSEFPIHASLNVVISGHPKPFLQASVPAAKRTTSFHVYQFFIPGLLFTLFVGKTVPPEQRAFCVVRGYGNPIIISDRFELAMFRGFLKISKSLDLDKFFERYGPPHGPPWRS